MRIESFGRVFSRAGMVLWKEPWIINVLFPLVFVRRRTGRRSRIPAWRAHFFGDSEDTKQQWVGRFTPVAKSTHRYRGVRRDHSRRRPKG
jgi:hypothetical protein